ILLGHQEYHQPNKLTSDDDTHQTLPLPYSLVYIDNTDSRPSKQPRLGLPYTAELEDGDDFQDSFLPLEASPEIHIPESPRLCCLSESLSDVPELLLPPVCQDTRRAQRRTGLRRVVDRRRLVDRRRRMIRSFGLAEARESERHLSGVKRPAAHSEDCY
ncbi:hypothetical protein FOZ62_024474, partial [Perkinsus olseni]